MASDDRPPEFDRATAPLSSGRRSDTAAYAPSKRFSRAAVKGDGSLDRFANHGAVAWGAEQATLRDEALQGLREFGAAEDQDDEDGAETGNRIPRDAVKINYQSDGN